MASLPATISWKAQACGASMHPRLTHQTWDQASPGSSLPVCAHFPMQHCRMHGQGFGGGCWSHAVSGRISAQSCRKEGSASQWSLHSRTCARRERRSPWPPPSITTERRTPRTREAKRASLYRGPLQGGNHASESGSGKSHLSPTELLTRANRASTRNLCASTLQRWEPTVILLVLKC